MLPVFSRFIAQNNLILPPLPSTLPPPPCFCRRKSKLSSKKRDFEIAKNFLAFAKDLIFLLSGGARAPNFNHLCKQPRFKKSPKAQPKKSFYVYYFFRSNKTFYKKLEKNTQKVKYERTLKTKLTEKKGELNENRMWQESKEEWSVMF